MKTKPRAVQNKTPAKVRREVLNKVRTGLPAAFVARLYALHPSTVQLWCKEEQIPLDKQRPGGGTLARMRAILTKRAKARAAKAARPEKPRCVRCKVSLPKSVLPLCVKTDRGLCCSNECARRLA